MALGAFTTAAAAALLLAPWAGEVMIPDKPETLRWSDGSPVPRSGDPPPFARQAVRSAEDRWSHVHGGLDPAGIVRAAMHRARTGRYGPGGSGLAQQVVKMTAHPRPTRTVKNKVREVAQAVQLRQLVGSDHILDLWISHAPTGRGTLAHGPDRWFGGSWHDMSLGAQALLVALPRQPSTLRPDRVENRSRIRSRVTHVLEAVFRDRPDWKIPGFDLDEAAERIPRPIDPRLDENDPSAAARIWALRTRCQECELPIQELAYSALRRTLSATWGLETAHRGGVHGAVVVTRRTDKGLSVVARIGGGFPADSVFDRTRAVRPPGSLAKLIIYLAALRAGMPPEQRFADIPVVWRDRRPWQPDNYGQSRHAPMPAYRALEKSVNRVALRIGLLTGMDVVSESASTSGFPWPEHPTPAALLGTGSGPVDSFGLAIHRIATVPGSVGTDLRRMLRGVVTRGTAAARLSATPGIIGKTGTSSDWRDAWFWGFDGKYGVLVWIGRDDNRPLPLDVAGRRVSGAAAAEGYRFFIEAGRARGILEPSHAAAETNLRPHGTAGLNINSENQKRSEP